MGSSRTIYLPDDVNIDIIKIAAMHNKDVNKMLQGWIIERLKWEKEADKGNDRNKGVRKY